MSTGDPVRDNIAAWMFNDIWGFDKRPPGEGNLPFGKAMLICAKGDGVLTQSERDWVLGYGAALDFSDAEIEELRNYQADEDIRDVLASSKLTSRSDVKLAAIFEAARASNADGDLAEAEIAVIVRMGSLLGVEEATVREVIGVYLAEVEAKAKRRKLIFPNGKPF
ncbi:MAG: hypothetical protein NTZ05_19145 [Chloroflexi bacterium]|nr:hypothetical protein [Chloroflexota bacterium]